MNQTNIPRMTILTACRSRRASTVIASTANIVALVSLTTLLAGCVNAPKQSPAGNRDHLLGWFAVPGRNEQNQVITGHDTLIPTFKQEGTYYSVCRGFEVPLKECTEGLEWAITPSSMTGTTIGWDAGSRTYYLAVMDAQTSNNTDGRSGIGEKEPMTRVETSPRLPNANARRPRIQDDLLGCYQPVWFPWVKIKISKKSGRYFSAQEFYEPGIWRTSNEERELTPLPYQLGFTGFERKGSHRLVYNESLKRFELVKTISKTPPSVIRMPLARISAPSKSDGGDNPPTSVRIGIPSWH